MKCRSCSGHGKRRDKDLNVIDCIRCKGTGRQENDFVPAILEMRKAGKSYEQIGRAFNITANRVIWYVKAAKL